MMKYTLLLALILLFVFVAYAKDEADNGADSEAGCDYGRKKQKYKFNLGDKKVEFEAENEAGDCKNKVHVHFGCKDSNCDLETMFENKADKSEAKSGLRVKLESLFEATTNTNAYQVVANSEHDLGSFTWTNFACSCGESGAATSESTALDGCASVIHCNQTGTKDVSGQTVTVRVEYYVVATPATALSDGYELNANAVKFSLHIENFQFSNPANFMAMRATVVTKAQTKMEGTGAKREEDDSRYKRGTKHVKGLAAVDGLGLWWEPTYTAGSDTTYDVLAVDDTSSSDDKKIVFIFNNAGSGVADWDPELSAGGANGASTLAVSMLAVFAVLFAFFRF